MKLISKIIMVAVSLTLALNSSTLVFAKDNIVEDGMIEIVEIEEIQNNEDDNLLNEGILDESETDTDTEKVKEDINIETTNDVVEHNNIPVQSELVVIENEVIQPISDLLVGSEEELINAINLGTGDVTVEFDVNEILLSETLVIDSEKINTLTFKSNNTNPINLINTGGNKHIEIIGDGDIKLNMYDVVITGNDLSNGGIDAKTVNNITFDGLNISDNYSKVPGWMTGFVNISATGDVRFNYLIAKNNIIAKESKQDTGLIRIEVVDGTVTFENSHIEATTIEGLMGNNILIAGERNKVVLSNVYVANSEVNQGSPAFRISSREDVDVLVDDSKFESNTTKVGDAGNLTIRSSKNINLQLNNSVFYSNFAYRGGAGLHVSTPKELHVEINNSIFNNNEAVEITYDKDTGVSEGLPSNGGAIYLSSMGGNASTLNISNSSFNENYASTGGAISLYVKDTYIKTLIENSDFTSNSADYSSGAISYYYAVDEEVEGALTINDSTFTSNVVSGKDNGPGYYRGGDGGAISLNKLRTFPNLLKTNNTKFVDNNAAIKNYWHHDKDSSEALNVAYSKNIINTTYSEDKSSNNLKNRDNIFNGDDVHFDKTAFVVLDFHEEDYEDLVVDNYNTENLVFFNAYVSTHFNELVNPTAEGYTFLGWQNADGEMWDFQEDILVPGMDKGQYYLHAVWAETVNTASVLTVKYLDDDLNEITDDKLIIGNVSEEYVVDVIHIEGYEFSHVVDNKSLTGIFENEDIEISLIYSKVNDEDNESDEEEMKEIIPIPEDEEVDDKIDNKDDQEDVTPPISESKDTNSNDNKKSELPNTGLQLMSLSYLSLMIVSIILITILRKSFLKNDITNKYL